MSLRRCVRQHGPAVLRQNSQEGPTVIDGEQPSLSRRKILYAFGVAAGSSVLPACSAGTKNQPGSGSSQTDNTAKGSHSKPVPTPTDFTESPLLAKQVKAGKLPAVEKRLPKHPYVIPHHWVQRGKYGGVLNMAAVSSQGASAANDNNREFFYGYSPLRYLNDGKDIGPGTVEKWSSNDDASEWTLHFRKGLRWSDGEPFKVDDVLFWWHGFAVPGNFGQSPPDWGRSEKGKLAKLKKVDNNTLKIIYNTPAPLFPDYLAGWTKGGTGGNGPIWVYPKHYLKQFHPKYNKKVPGKWDSVGGLWEKKSDPLRNPDCPTLAGFRCKSFNSKKGVVLERNPYYWAVTKDGDQLPYIDEITIDTVQKAQVLKLQIEQGKIDFCHGQLNQVGLSDVSTFSKAKDKADIDIIQWHNGSGTGMSFFLNYDYPDKEIRKIFRDPRFRQAISHAHDRKAVQKSIYYTTGTLTTGTLSPNTLEFQGSDGKKIYREWRDSYVKHDPDKAKKLLDDLGLTDKDNDGYVELPSGKKLTVQIDYPADMPKDAGQWNDKLVTDCKKIGLRLKRNPVSPQSFGPQWESGKLMAHAPWDISNTGSMLVEPLFVVPVEASRWAPLEGQYYALRDTKKEKQGINKSNPWKSKPPRLEPENDGPVAKLWHLLDKARVEPDETKRKKLVWEITKIHIKEGPFIMGSVSDTSEVVVAKNDLKNVPRKENLAQGGLVTPWTHPTPAAYDPETWFWSDPKKHT